MLVSLVSYPPTSKKINPLTSVIEPEGIVEIKMRKEKLTSLMDRLDTTYSAYKKASKDQSCSAEERAAASSELAKRESDLMPTYKQIALLYADLHE